MCFLSATKSLTNYPNTEVHDLRCILSQLCIHFPVPERENWDQSRTRPVSHFWNARFGHALHPIYTINSISMSTNTWVGDWVNILLRAAHQDKHEMLTILKWTVLHRYGEIEARTKTVGSLGRPQPIPISILDTDATSPQNNALPNAKNWNSA